MGQRCRGAAFGVVATAWALGLLARAAVGQDMPVVSIVGGTGMPGGTVAALTALDNDPDGRAASADLLVRFPTDALTFDPANCTLAARLNATHALSGTTPNPGEVQLAIDPVGTPTALGDGPLATCDIGIQLGAVAGTAALDLSSVLFSGDGSVIPSESLDGAIVIVSSEPTATATHTDTPTSTPTVTETPLPTLTPTPSATPTATLFQPTVLFDRFGNSCAVSGPDRAAAWPLLGALALLMRRRFR